MKLILVCTLALFASSAIAATPQQPAPVDPNKPVTVTISVQDWQAVLSSVSDSGHVSARDANRIGQSIVSQVQSQISPGAAQTKK
jgi:hypothetical protein